MGASPRDTKSLNAIISLALEAMESELSVSENVERIQAYFDALEEAIPKLDEWANADQAGLKALADKHAAILERTAKLRDETSKDLQNLKKRGLAIRAYIDIHPKRISISRMKRG